MYEMSCDSGIWKHRADAKQLIDYTDLQVGNMRPMDIDGIIEYKNKVYVFLEYKFMDAPVPAGQRLCLERLVNDTVKAGKSAIAIVARHNVKDPSQDIAAGKAMSNEVYWNGKWCRTRPTSINILVKNFIKYETGEVYERID